MGEVVNGKKKEKADILEVYPESAKKELEAIPEVYAILDDVKKKEIKEDNVFEFTNQILDTTQEEVSKTDNKKESLFKDGEDAISWDDI